MKNIVKAASVGLIGLLAACGSLNSQGTPSSLTATSPEVQATASAALDDLNTTAAMLDSSVSGASLRAGASVQGVNSLEAAALSWNIPPRIYALLRDLGIWIPVRGTTAAAGCTITVNTSSTAPQYTVSFNCTGTSPLDTRSYATTGEIDLTYQNGSNENAGFSAAFKGFDTLITFSDKSSIERKLDGTLALDKSAWLADPTKPWNIQKSYTDTRTRKDTSGTTLFSGQNVFSVSKTYQPDSQATPGAAGLITIAQSAPGSDAFTNLLNSKTRSLSFYTNPTIHYNSACSAAPRFDAGEKDYLFTSSSGVQSTLAIKFSGCGSYTITFNGGTVPTTN